MTYWGDFHSSPAGWRTAGSRETPPHCRSCCPSLLRTPSKPCRRCGRNGRPSSAGVSPNGSAALEALKGRHFEQLEIDFGGSDQPEAFKRARRDDRSARIERVFKDYRDWLENTHMTEPEPYLQVTALFTRQPA